MTDLLSTGLKDPLVGGGTVNITYGRTVALATAAAADWWKANAATMLRTPQESGNAVQPQPTH